jgi:ABC-type glycerol-3-phosphate transport system substrate-binding protein
MIRNGVRRPIACQAGSRVRLLALALCLISAFPGALGLFAEGGKEKAAIRWSRSSSVSEYLKRYQDAPIPEKTINVKASGYVASAGASLARLPEYKGEKDVVQWTGESGWVEWAVSVPETGLYRVALRYIPLESKAMDVEFAVKVDGAQPYDDYASVMFPRVWVDETAIRKDTNGNDLRPNQIEAPEWSWRDFIDTQGFYNKSLPIYLTQGSHRFRLELRREALALSQIRFYNPAVLPTNQDLQAAYAEKGYAPTKGILAKVQAEVPVKKSDSTLVATYDRSDAATQPSDPAKIKLNTIGGNWTWKLPGQWVEWKVSVPEDGLYKFYVKARQNNQRGMAAVRKVYVDGQIPSQEFETVEFPYSLQWGNFVPKQSGAKKPALIYLTKGEHVVRMESTLGRLTPILTAVDDLTYEVNTLRRRFVMIMGAEPDLNRDYQLDKEVPGLTDKLLSLAERFTEQADEFERITGQKGSDSVSTLRNMADEMNDFAKHPEYIPHHQTKFRDNIAALATWILYRKEIPLEIDYLGFASPEKKLPAPGANFFAQSWMAMRSFVASFVEDYNSIGKKEGGKAITVWISSGRDQAQILRDLITNDFTPKTGIKVNLSLVQGSLIEATLAGRGPEIALSVSRGQPVNLASRNALYDLSKFTSFPDVKGRFTPTAFVPYSYRGGVYALPLTQDFYMMFYRKDIFNELGIKPPETWEDIYAIIPILQRNNMQVGLPYQQTDAVDLVDAGMGSRNLFPTLLMQQGGSFYVNEDRQTGLTQAPAYNAFKQWTAFYSSYGFALKYDFYTRFRAGEMPLGIASYGMFNQFTAAAPEIRNEWAMVPIPGVRRPDGSVNRSEASSGAANIMFKKIKDPEAGWAFLDWWTSSSVQLSYGRQLETLLGKAARLNTANLKTFDGLPWSKAEADVIREQWKDVQEVPEVPGGYYTVRMLDTAFSKVYYGNENPRATLYKYCQMINEEITRKRKELGLQ